MNFRRIRAASGRLAGGSFSSLAIRDHRLLLFGNLAFQTSIGMQQLVIGWLLLELGDTPFWLGMGGLATGLAMVMMSPLSGALADAWERRRVLLLTQATVIAVNGSIVLLLALDRLAIWHLLLGSFAMGTAFTMNMPARQSLTAEIVGRRLLRNATALHSMSLNLNRIVAPATAGALLGLVGPMAVLVGNLVANCVTVRMLTSIRYRPGRPSAPFRPRGAELVQGFVYALREPRIVEVLSIVSVTSFFGLAYVQLLPSLARDTLRVGPEGLGMLTASIGGGALTGSLLLARFGHLAPGEQLLRRVGIVLGLLLVCVGQVGVLPLAMLILALVGVSSSMLMPLGIAALQELVPDELSGRVLGVYMLTMGLMPLGSLPAGILADRLGTGPAISIFGLTCAILTLGLAIVRASRFHLRAAAGRPAALPDGFVRQRLLRSPATPASHPPSRSRSRCPHAPNGGQS